MDIQIFLTHLKNKPVLYKLIRSHVTHKYVNQNSCEGEAMKVNCISVERCKAFRRFECCDSINFYALFNCQQIIPDTF